MKAGLKNLFHDMMLGLFGFGLAYAIHNGMLAFA